MRQAQAGLLSSLLFSGAILSACGLTAAVSVPVAARDTNRSRSGSVVSQTVDDKGNKSGSVIDNDSASDVDSVMKPSDGANSAESRELTDKDHANHEHSGSNGTSTTDNYMDGNNSNSSVATTVRPTAMPTTVPSVTPTLPPGMLTVSQIMIPDTLKSDSPASVSFTISNSGAPIQGFFALVEADAGIGKKNFDLESSEMIPNGTTQKTLTFKVPSIPFPVKGKACVTAYADSSHTKSISQRICKDISLSK